MANRNSRIIFSKGIKIDRNYNNVLSYSESDMLALLRSNTHLVTELTDCSFIRKTSTIQVNITYEQALQSNYIAFENPDYSYKWFFAWIDEVKYIGERCVEISYTIDAWTSFFGSWTRKKCFINRQHVAVADDIPGNYTLPEGLETGEYVIDELIKPTELDDVCYVINSTATTTGLDDPNAVNFGGMFMPGYAYVTDSISALIQIMQVFDNMAKPDAIYNVYMIPKAILNFDWQGQSLEYHGQSGPLGFSKLIDKATSLDGYTPVNKKLLTKPYCFLNVSNVSGCINTYAYELFKDVDVYNGKCYFDIQGVPTVGGSIKCVPVNYKNGEEKLIEDEGLFAGKYPTLPWSEDAYTVWQTANSLNLSLGIAGEVIEGVSGLLSLNVGKIGGAINSELNRQAMMVQHSLQPRIAKGNTNGGDYNSSMRNNTFIFSKMSIRQEYAKIIDDYFTRYGYAIKKLELPNITGRPNWNYVEIGQGEEIGYGNVPSKYMDAINNACRKGVTIWHSHANLGDYSLNNR